MRTVYHLDGSVRSMSFFQCQKSLCVSLTQSMAMVSRPRSLNDGDHKRFINTKKLSIVIAIEGWLERDADAHKRILLLANSMRKEC